MNGSKNPNSEVYQTLRPTPSRTDQRILHGKRASKVFDWAGVPSEELLHLVSRVAGNGDLCCIGLTSDGGAVSITVVSNNTRFKTYAKDGEELVSRISDLLAELY